VFRITAMFKVLIILFIIIFNISFAAETCSRVAIINYQEVLVDAGSNKKGEGLRFYLEKDGQSKALLDAYQDKNRPTIWGAATSTIGSFMILSGLVQTSNSANSQNKNSLMLGGGILVALSYLTSKTLQYNNEALLQNSIDQYNQRNLPRIYFSPTQDNGKLGIGLGINQGF
jgi:hypothetical protein